MLLTKNTHTLKLALAGDCCNNMHPIRFLFHGSSGRKRENQANQQSLFRRRPASITTVAAITIAIAINHHCCVSDRNLLYYPACLLPSSVFFRYIHWTFSSLVDLIHRGQATSPSYSSSPSPSSYRSRSTFLVFLFPIYPRPHARQSVLIRLAIIFAVVVTLIRWYSFLSKLSIIPSSSIC